MPPSLARGGRFTAPGSAPVRIERPEPEPPPAFCRDLEAALDGGSERYTGIVQRLSVPGRAAGRAWLAAIRAQVASQDVLDRVPPLQTLGKANGLSCAARQAAA